MIYSPLARAVPRTPHPVRAAGLSFGVRSVKYEEITQ